MCLLQAVYEEQVRGRDTQNGPGKTPNPPGLISPSRAVCLSGPCVSNLPLSLRSRPESHLSTFTMTLRTLLFLSFLMINGNKGKSAVPFPPHTPVWQHDMGDVRAKWRSKKNLQQQKKKKKKSKCSSTPRTHQIENDFKNRFPPAPLLR